MSRISHPLRICGLCAAMACANHYAIADEVAKADSVAVTNAIAATVESPSSNKVITAAATNAVKGSFAWGAEAGGSIDMSANDMSSIDFTAYFGYKRGWIKFIGIGAEIDIMLNNSARSFPVYLSFKTNFRSRPSLVFLDLRAGISANYLPNDYQQTGAYVFGGLGINLASGKKFASYVVLGYSFKNYSDLTTRSEEIFHMKDVHTASVRLGVTF